MQEKELELRVLVLVEKVLAPELQAQVPVTGLCVDHLYRCLQVVGLVE